MIATAMPPITIAIDLKKSRIRIHKSLLHMTGDPKYIQLLVNPNNKYVAIRALKQNEPHENSERIRPIDMMAENSIEFYSKYFIQKLCELVDELDTDYSYRLMGTIVPTHNMAVFSLDTLTPIEKEGEN